jgi:outer membrane protein assembly factor BamB
MSFTDPRNRRRARSIFLTIAAVTAMGVAGCSTVDRFNPFRREQPQSRASPGARVPVLAMNQQLEVADALRGQDFQLPPPTRLDEWPLPGGTPAQSIEHVDAAPAFEIAWRRGIGAGSNRRRHVTSPPVMAAGRLYVMDGAAGVSAIDANSGHVVWRTNIMPRSRRDREAWGGGIAYADGKLYVTSGFREVVQLDAVTGQLGWRTRTDAPMHAAPTVFGGRVFAVAVDDNLLTFDAATGTQGWTYQALTEPARLIGASSPAVEADTVVTAFASGEVIALRAQNGNDLWNTPLNQQSRINALSEIRDIVGRPVIYRGDVYAASHAGAFAAIDLRSGQPRWTLPVSSISTPWPAGDVVYVVSRAGEVICVARESGQVYWVHDMNAGRNRRNRAIWTGPILVSNRLVVVSSRGDAVALDPKTGAPGATLRLGGRALITPIAAGGMMYVVTDNGQLVAVR